MCNDVLLRAKLGTTQGCIVHNNLFATFTCMYSHPLHVKPRGRSSPSLDPDQKEKHQQQKITSYKKQTTEIKISQITKMINDNNNLTLHRN